MITLSATQDALARRPGAVPVFFIVLTTYTNRASGTVQSRWYWSNRDLYYPYDGTDRFFRNVVIVEGESISITRRLGDLRPAPLAFSIVNELDVDGDSIFSELKAANLYGATVEIARAFVDHEEAARLPRSIPTADHTVLYRGELELVSEQSGVITLQFDSPKPQIFIREALGPKTAVKDFGKRYPCPFGSFDKVKAVTISCGGVTTLAEELPKGRTGAVQLTDASRFPPGLPFSAWINGEEIAFSGRSDDTAFISARAQSGTREAIHPAGDVVVEIADIILAYAPYRCGGINRVHIRAPQNQELVALDISFTHASGAAQSIITISASELRTVLTALFVSAAVTVQPAYEASG